MLERVWRKGTLSHCWWQWKLVKPLWRIVWRFLKKLDIELPYDPAILVLGIHIEEIGIERDTCTPVFIAALFTIARMCKQSKYSSTEEWIRKMWYTTQSWKGMKKSICRDMDRPTVCQSEVSHEEKQIYVDIYIWNLEKWYKWNYLQNKNSLTDIENKLMVTKGEGGMIKLGSWD